MQKHNILIVDDEKDICEILAFNLEDEGFNVDTCNSAEEALRLDLGQYHIMLLDIMMGKISGTKLARMIKKDEELSNIPIIFLTAKYTEVDKLIGFKIGADDYIVKPFSVKEVVARINAILKRTYPDSDMDLIQYKNIIIDARSKKVKVSGRAIKFTKKEFNLLSILVKNIGRVFSREELLNHVWHDEGDIYDRTIDVNIRRIRKKLEEHGSMIHTRSGYGYYFE